MGRTAAAKKNPPTSKTENKRTSAKPEGYRKQSMDIAGFWNPEQGPVHAIFRGASLFDNKLDKTKSSVLLFAELLEPCECVNQEDEAFTAQKGDVVGVWGKPGMRALRNLCGVPVWMQEAGEKDIGKGNPMKLFEILSPKQGTPIPILEDNRKESAGSKTFLTVASAKKPAEQEVSNTGDDDDVPF